MLLIKGLSAKVHFLISAPRRYLDDKAALNFMRGVEALFHDKRIYAARLEVEEPLNGHSSRVYRFSCGMNQKGKPRYIVDFLVNGREITLSKNQADPDFARNTCGFLSDGRASAVIPHDRAAIGALQNNMRNSLQSAIISMFPLFRNIPDDRAPKKPGF